MNRETRSSTENISGRHVLPIAAKIGKAQVSLAEDLQEAWRTAAELNVRPAGLRDRGDVETIACRDESALAGTEPSVRFIERVVPA